jgi:hypothetical protein
MMKNKAKRSVNPEIINNRFRRTILHIELKKLHIGKGQAKMSSPVAITA